MRRSLRRLHAKRPSELHELFGVTLTLQSRRPSSWSWSVQLELDVLNLILRDMRHQPEVQVVEEPSQVQRERVEALAGRFAVDAAPVRREGRGDSEADDVGRLVNSSPRNSTISISVSTSSSSSRIDATTQA